MARNKEVGLRTAKKMLAAAISWTFGGAFIATYLFEPAVRAYAFVLLLPTIWLCSGIAAWLFMMVRCGPTSAKQCARDGTITDSQALYGAMTIGPAAIFAIVYVEMEDWRHG